MYSTTGRECYVSGIPPALLQHPTLSTTAKLLGCCLLMHRNRESNLCYPTHETLALESGTSVKTAYRGIKELREHGLITWENREAPKGEAKGRANSYDLSGLDALRSISVQKASQIAERTKTTRHGEATSKNVRSRRDKNDPSLRTNRAITVNSYKPVIDSTSASDNRELAELKVTVATANGKVKPTEAGERTKTTTHSARTAQAGPLKGLSRRRIQEQRIAPDGTSACDVATEADAWDLARYVVEDLAGGEELNPGAITRLCETYGSDRVWWHAKWFLSRLAALKSSPEKPAAYFVQCVREDYPASPTWPIVTEFEAELAQIERRLAADNYREPHDWFKDFDRADHLRMKIADPSFEPSEPSQELVDEMLAVLSPGTDLKIPF
jgi:hypothetical protein